MKQLILITVADSWHHFEKPIKEYEKRLQKELDLVLLKPSKYDDIEACRQRDTKNVIDILQKYPSSYIVFCDLGGKSFGSTEKFAEWMNIKSQKYKGIVFVIWGSYGLDPLLMKTVVHESLSLWEWTLPHALASLIVIEQLYRVTNLLAGGKYHH